MSDADRRASNFLTAITYLRVALVPIIMALVMAGHRVRYAYAIAAVLFAIAAVTDFFDGFLARRWAKASTLGSFLDTTADKLLVSGALVALVAVDRASVWIAFLIIGRELVILGLRGAIAAGGEVMSPSIWGKLKANAQFLAITLAIVRIPDRVGPLFVDQYFMLLAAAATVASAVEYLARFARVFMRAGDASSPP
ncbi:MAG: CDP-diacylglycerol--glycerol-3-phosphate 3-phosphatidyltransferase [Actinomycetota bacterium]